MLFSVSYRKTNSLSKIFGQLLLADCTKDSKKNKGLPNGQIKLRDDRYRKYSVDPAHKKAL